MLKIARLERKIKSRDLAYVLDIPELYLLILEAGKDLRPAAWVLSTLSGMLQLGEDFHARLISLIKDEKEASPERPHFSQQNHLLALLSTRESGTRSSLFQSESPHEESDFFLGVIRSHLQGSRKIFGSLYPGHSEKY